MAAGGLESDGRGFHPLYYRHVRRKNDLNLISMILESVSFLDLDLREFYSKNEVQIITLYSEAGIRFLHEYICFGKT